MAYTFHWLSYYPAKLPTPVLTNLSADGICKYSVAVISPNVAIKTFVDGVQLNVTQWSYAYSGGVYTITIADSVFTESKEYSITAQAYLLDGGSEDSDISEPITFTKESAGYILDGVYMVDDIIESVLFLNQGISVNFSVVDGNSYSSMYGSGDPLLAAFYYDQTQVCGYTGWIKQNYRIIQFNNAALSKEDWTDLSKILSEKCYIPSVRKVSTGGSVENYEFQVVYPSQCIIGCYINGVDMGVIPYSNPSYDENTDGGTYTWTILDSFLQDGENTIQFYAESAVSGQLKRSDLTEEFTVTKLIRPSALYTPNADYKYYLICYNYAGSGVYPYYVAWCNSDTLSDYVDGTNTSARGYFKNVYYSGPYSSEQKAFDAIGTASTSYTFGEFEYKYNTTSSKGRVQMFLSLERYWLYSNLNTLTVTTNVLRSTSSANFARSDSVTFSEVNGNKLPQIRDDDRIVASG